MSSDHIAAIVLNAGGWAVGSHRLVWHPVAVIILLVPFSGCQTLHQLTPVDVQVRDAETNAPIEGAHVRIWYPSTHSVAMSGVTGQDGLVRIQSPPIEDSPLMFEAMARGYLPHQSGQPIERTSAAAILEMYAEPRPIVELVIPTGYRGTVKTTISVQNNIKAEPRARLFSYPVPSSGVVTIALPSIFPRGITPDIRTRYADGTPLPRDAKDYELGCRWLKADPESEYLFVIGTQWEADSIRRDMKKAATGRNTLGEDTVTGFGRFK